MRVTCLVSLRRISVGETVTVKEMEEEIKSVVA